MGGPLGPGWTHSHNWKLADNGASVVIRRGDGRQDTFTRNADGTYADPPNVFDTLAKNADGTFTLTLTSQVQYEFSSVGQLTRIHEPAGNQVTLAYTAGNLTTLSDTVGRLVTLGYDASNRLLSLGDPLGRKVTYAYDASGRLATVTDKIGNTAGQTPAQHQWKYAYDGTSRHLTTITDPDGRVRVANTYDASGRVVQQRDGLGALTTMSYGPGQTLLTDPRGHRTTYTFDGRMRLLTQQDVVSASTFTVAYSYDAAGNRTSVTDRNGNRSDFTYDNRGNVLTKTDPQLNPATPRFLTRFSYDVKNNLTQLTDAKGFLTTLTYDAATNVLLSVSRQIDATTSALTRYEYADTANPGLPTRIIAPRGNLGATPDAAFATTLSYDAQGNLVTRIDPDAAKTTFSYDAAGRLTSFVDPDGNAAGALPAEHAWSIGYDENDRETSRTDPLGNVLRYSYDGAGNRTSLADRNGRVTLYTYNANSRLAAVQQQPDPFGTPSLVYTTQVNRDANGNATRITQGNGVATDYSFDELNRLISVATHPTATTTLTTSYVLDGNGQPTSRTTGDGVSVGYTYDTLSRLTRVSGPAVLITYAYDELGRRTRLSDATGSTTYGYDGLGRLIQVAAPAGTLSYAYDRDGNRASLGFPGGQSVSYTYSPGGRLTRVSDWAPRVSSYSYLASGLVSAVTYPNGMQASYTYDRAQRLMGATNAVGGATITRDTYTLDAEGNRIGRIDVRSTQFGYGYDGLNRLRSFVEDTRPCPSCPDLIFDERYTYDGATNITSRGSVDVVPPTWTYDQANRLLSDDTRSFTWSAADRLLQRGSDTFGYDALERLSSATIGGTTRTYNYDGDGLLRSRTEGAATTSFLYDVSAAPAPLVQAGAERIVYGLGALYRVHADGTIDAFARDALGSVMAEVSAAGSITNSFSYSPYGAVGASGALPLLGFAGELTDPSGLLYLRARWYDPSVGRFITRDALRGSPRDPSSLNVYAYAGGNPVRFVDPEGYCPWCLAAVVGAAIGGSASLAGYLLVSGESRNLRDALVAFGGGAVSGAVCVATAFLACAVATTTVSIAQYGFSSGAKSLGGYVVAGAIGLVSAPFVYTPYKPPSAGIARWVFELTRPGRLGEWERGPLRSGAGSFIRSFLTSLFAGYGEQALGAEEEVLYGPAASTGSDQNK